MSPLLGKYQDLIGRYRHYTAQVVALDLGSGLLNFLEPIITIIFVNEVVLKVNLNLLYVVIGVRLSTVTVSRYLRWLHRFHRARLGQKLLSDLRQKMFRRYLEQPPSFFEKNPPSKLVALTSAEVDALDAIHRAYIAAFGFLFSFTFIVTAGVFIDPWLTVVILVPLPCIGLVLILDKRMRQRNRVALEMQSYLISFLKQLISNVLTTQAFTREATELQRFGKVANDVMHARSLTEEASEAKTNFADLIRSIAMTAILLVGGVRIIRDRDISLGAVLAMNGYAILLYLLVNENIELFVKARQATVALQRVHDVLAQAPPLALDNRGAELTRAGGHVAFENVWFRYGPDEPWALRDVSFEVRPGRLTAIVGMSGSGKSTLFQLLLRFYEATQGSIRLDGQDITRVRLGSLRRQIGLATQDAVVLGDMTIRENIRYGREGATLDEVKAAARAAMAHDFIDRMPLGYDTVVGESAGLSGGQRQRLALSRVILKDAPVLLLDEFTAALDAKTEAEIGAVIDGFCRTHTTIVIAHRLSTVIHADEILVMNEGQIAQRGTHRELYAQKTGVYRQLFERQFKGVLDAVTGRPAGEAGVE